MSRSIILKIEQAVRNRARSATLEHPIAAVIETAEANGHSYELFHEEARDYAPKFPGGLDIIDQFPVSRYRLFIDQLNGWPVHPFEVIDTTGLRDVKQGNWNGDDDFAMAALKELSNELPDLKQAKVTVQSDVANPILVMKISDIIEGGIELFSTTADLYLLDIHDRFIIHFCRHGRWAYGARPS